MFKILFLCTHNRCRSILSEAITNHLAGDELEARSAGSHPAGEVHPDTLKYLQLTNFPITHLASKSWEDLPGFTPDVVVTVCDQAAGEACPIWLQSTAKVHWGLPDPSKIEDRSEREEAYKQVIETISQRITRLKEAALQLSDTQELVDLMNQIAKDVTGEK